MEVVSVDSTAVQAVGKKTPPIRLTGLRLGFDPARHLIAVFSEFYENPLDNWELQGDLMINNRWFISGAYGYSRVGRGDLSVGKSYFYTNEGSYTRFGLDYNLLGGKTQYDAVYVGFRYNTASFEHKITGSRPAPYWQDPDKSGAQLINGEVDGIFTEGLSANWTSLVIGFKVRLIGGLYAGVEGRLDNLGFVSESLGFSVVEVPGYGIIREGQGAKYSFSYSLLYKIPFWKHPSYLVEEK